MCPAQVTYLKSLTRTAASRGAYTRGRQILQQTSQTSALEMKFAVDFVGNFLALID